MPTLVLHLFPVNPAGQEQAKSSIKSVQLLPSKQGDSAQSSMLSAQSGPSHPARQTHFQWDALGRIGARIGGAGVQGATAIGSSVARPAQAGELAMSGLVLAHGPVVAGRPVAAGLFLLALEAGIAGRAGAGVALLLVATSSAIVAGLGGAVVDVDFAETASESGRTVAEGRVGL